ncbi:DnaT-like ssDNA-binding protein [Methylobacterium terrae]|nr:DnaT-like ssDNA-binding protein [Methylobacterium terrae]
MIIEDGTGLHDAASYIALADADAYHLASRNDAWLAPDIEVDFREAALVRATRFIDARYRARFPGYRRRGRGQALEWPRVGAYTYVPEDGRTAYTGTAYGWDRGYEAIPETEIPRELKDAVCEAALRELAEPGSLAPDLERGGGIQSITAGSVSVTYGAGATAGTTFQAVGMAIAPLLIPATAGVGRAVRD